MTDANAANDTRFESGESDSDTGNIAGCGGSEATGIYRIADGSRVTHVERGTESEIRASRCRATGVVYQALQNESNSIVRPDAVAAVDSVLRYLETRPDHEAPTRSVIAKVQHFITAGDLSPGFNYVLCLEDPDGVFNHLDVSLGIAGKTDAPGIVEGGCALHVSSVLWNKREIVNGVLLSFRSPQSIARFLIHLASHLDDMGMKLLETADLAGEADASNEKPEASHGGKVNE